MKSIEKDELYEHFRGFLKTKGIELKEGSYSQTIQKSCSILADAINLSQRGIEKAKTGIDDKLDKMRQVIHEKTAPKPPSASTGPTAAAPGPNSEPQAKTAGTGPARAKRAARKGTPQKPTRRPAKK